MRAAMQRFLAAAPEHERIAALQAAHAFALKRAGDEQFVDFLLRQSMARGFFADENHLGVRPAVLQ